MGKYIEMGSASWHSSYALTSQFGPWCLRVGESNFYYSKNTFSSALFFPIEENVFLSGSSGLMKAKLPLELDALRVDTPALAPTADLSSFYIVQTIVKNGSDVGSELVSRMEALYLLCRNSIIPSFFLILGLFFGTKRFVEKKVRLKFWATLLTWEFLLIIATAIMFHTRVVSIINGLVLMHFG